MNIIYPKSYAKAQQQLQATPAFHQTLRIWILQSLNTLDSTMTLSPFSSAVTPCLVFLMLLDGSERACGWDLVLSGPTVGAKCSYRLT